MLIILLSFLGLRFDLGFCAVLKIKNILIIFTLLKRNDKQTDAMFSISMFKI
jgi:hypothetical protein